MDIVISRRGGVALKEQIKAQIELRILGGEFRTGQRLPSVRALARRLHVHPNTVSAAYQMLEEAGHLRLKAGSGVFVRSSGPAAPEDARDVDEMIRLTLKMALAKGFTGQEVRAAVERWLGGTPPDRVVAIDRSREMGELLVAEMRLALKVKAVALDLEELRRKPAVLQGALAVALPYHVEEVRRLAPAVAVESVTLEVSDEDRQSVLALPSGAIILVVSHSPTVLPFASVLVRSLRGDEVLVEARLLSAPKEWSRLIRVADIVFGDVLSIASLRKAGARRAREVRFLHEPLLARLRAALTLVTPRAPN